jgi:hypothetical protein
MINEHFLETARHCGQPIHSVHYGLGRTGRTADYFFEPSGRAVGQGHARAQHLPQQPAQPLIPRAWPNRTDVFARSLLGILAERAGLIAQTGPLRLARPPALCRQLAVTQLLGRR